jgi:hypothetical protein
LFTNVGLTGSSFNATAGNSLPSIQDTGVDITDGSPPTPGPNNASSDYFTFTVTPLPGVTLGYSTLSFDVATLTSDTANNSFTISLQTSMNSFVNLASTTITGSTTFQNVQWDLSSLAQTSAPTDFHLVIRDNTTATTKGILLDNITLTANVSVMPIPEPFSLALLGIGVFIGAQRLRRKVKR